MQFQAKSHKNVLLLAASFIVVALQAQKTNFTRQDSLRGTVNKERSWWDVLHYDITVKPDFNKKTTSGKNTITYKVVEESHSDYMQIDLQEPLHIDSIIADDTRKLTFSKEGNAWHVQNKISTDKKEGKITVYFNGTPREAVRAPWDGGWSFSKDSLNRPLMTVTCQGLGASIWYPNKDHQSDEPDNGATLTMTVPNKLTAVANGRLKEKQQHKDGTTSYTWEVKNPINNYNIIPYIGHYVNFKETYAGLKGNLDLDYWVLDYNLEKAKSYLPNEVHNMLNSFEYWFGPYPFYEDGFKLVDVDHTGMEHQSAVAYGNHYKPGYRGRDGSGTGLGLLWDFIVIHESGHEWFGNNITTKDLADMYIHEGFTNYSETLFIESMYGGDAANDYNHGIRRGIRNDRPIIPEYGVNAQGSGDMYTKGSNMIHTIRHSINNDQLFRNILTGLNTVFYHETVTADEVHTYISIKAGFDYSQVFHQYLKTTQIPEILLYADAKNNRMYFKYANCEKGFNLPLSLVGKHTSLKIFPTTEWQSVEVSNDQYVLFSVPRIEKMYYVTPKVLNTLEK